jgi:prolyl-tRNA synthetase
MRGREFLMKDAYSFDLDYAAARRSYQKMFVAYLRTFARMGLKAIPMIADTGPIGGDLSHEFIILAATGESQVFCDRVLIERDILSQDIDYEGDLSPLVEEWTRHYAATDEKHDAEIFARLPEGNRIEARGIEVGHIFYFGTKYSVPMKAEVQSQDSKPVAVHMGSYGIGVSRLVGAIIEASHDEKGIIWPENVAPFELGLVNLKSDDILCRTLCDDLYAKLSEAGKSVLYDDRDERPGAKFAEMDLIGLPWQIVIGPKGTARGMAELKNRRSGESIELSLPALLNRITA